MDALNQKVSKKLLPVEYGGEAGTMEGLSGLLTIYFCLIYNKNKI